MNKIILYIDSMQKGGAQRVMSVIADYLDNEGLQVILVNDIIPKKNVPEYCIPISVKRVFLDRENDNKLWKNVFRIARLRSIIKNENADCVLSFLGPPNIRMLFSTIGLPIRKVVSVRNDPKREYGEGIKGGLLKRLLMLSDLVVFQTGEAAESFSLCIQKKSTVIPNPIDEVFFQDQWTGAGKDIIAVGRLQPQKNYNLLIHAFSYIADKYPNTNLIILGDGPLRAELETLRDELGLSQRIVFQGVVSDVSKYLMKSRMFVLSSDFEGMPNALMEAMAVGLPVIATDCPCGGPKELTDSGKYGLLVPCNDARILSDAMRLLQESDVELNYYHKQSAKRSKEYKTETIMHRWLMALSDIR